MHGHRLRAEAERNHVSLWTDVSVGAVYGAMKRLASEGLPRDAGQEREGNGRPGSYMRWHYADDLALVHEDRHCRSLAAVAGSTIVTLSIRSGPAIGTSSVVTRVPASTTSNVHRWTPAIPADGPPHRIEYLASTE
jgi:hypothetical protein